MPQAHVLRDPEIPGVTRITLDESLPRPHVGVMGAIHGNELCGLEAIGQIIDDAEHGRLPLRQGTLVLIHGNPKATQQGRRQTEGGDDLNRVFDLSFLDRLPEKAWGEEHRRALELRPLVEDLDVLIDLHSASEDTPPFAIVNERGPSRDIAYHLGLHHVTHAWNEVSDKVAVSILTRLGKPALSVECGQHDDPRSVERARTITDLFLRTCEVLEGEPPPASDVVFFEVTDILKKPSARFRFARRIRGLSLLEAGESIGSDGTIELRLERTCYALLPNEDAAVGGDMLYLAQPVE